MLEILLAALFGGGSSFAFLLYVFLKYPEKIERWASILLKFFAFISKKAEKKRITTFINSKVEMKRKEVERESGGCIPFGLRVEFVDDIEDHKLYRRENVLILKMKNHRNDSENLARATCYYISKALLPYSKQYLDPTLSKSIDYVVAKKFLERDHVAMDFLKKLYKDLMEQEIGKETIEKVERVEEEGFLTRICLREYQKFGEKFPKEPTDDDRKESKVLLNKLFKLVTKDPEERVDLSVDGEIIKIRIVPVSAPYKDIERHYKFVEESLRLGYKNFYVVAAGRNTKKAENLVSLLTQDRELKLVEEFKDIYEGTYRGQKMKLFCALVSRRDEE